MEFNNVYKLGDQATYVKTITEKLNRLGYNCGTPDIYYTSLVAQRVKEFQKDHGLAIDGKVGPLTHAKMFEATPTTNSRPILRQGARSAAVRTLQNLLTKFGFTCSADGIFGANTKAQVVAFQKSNSLSPDGVVGPQTWAKLYQENNIVAPPKTGERPIVRKGDENSYVGEIQGYLLNMGYFTNLASVTGRYGEDTYLAVRQFQQTHGLVADGIVGRNTWPALQSIGKTNISTAQPNLANGSRHPAVKTLQQKLIGHGYSVGTAGADGIFGSNTLEAVKLFQTKNGLVQSTEVDQAFWAVLNSANAKGPGDSINSAIGSKGQVVRLIQGLLENLGYDIGSTGVDGIFGRATYNAVRTFQANTGLMGQADVQEGVVGDKTMSALTNANNSIKKDPNGFIILKKGMRDPVPGIGENDTTIFKMQQKLRDLGYDIGNSGVDGIFGDKTYNAVRQFQVQHGILPMGEYTKETENYLLAKTAKRADYVNAQTETLKMGSTGEAVRAAQAKLEELGYYCGPMGADGVFGIHTYNAVREFQSNNYLQVDGIIGVKTFEKLHKASNPVKGGYKSPGGSEPPLYKYDENVEQAANNLIRVAVSQLGESYEPKAVTKYGRWYNNTIMSNSYDYSNDPWCNMFVSWCAHMAGVIGVLVPKHSYTEDSKNWYGGKGAFHTRNQYKPKKGDSIYFLLDTSDPRRSVTHVGLVEAVEDKLDNNGRVQTYVHTIEGNRTRNSKRCVIRDSFISTDSRIVGYGNIRAIHSQLPAGPNNFTILCNNSMDAKYHSLIMNNASFLCGKCDYAVPRPSRLDQIVLFANGNDAAKESYYKIKALEAAALNFIGMKTSKAIPQMTTNGNIHAYHYLGEKSFYLSDQERTKYKSKYEFNNDGKVNENAVYYNHVMSKIKNSNPIINVKKMLQSDIDKFSGKRELDAIFVFKLILAFLPGGIALDIIGLCVNVFQAWYQADLLAAGNAAREDMLWGMAKMLGSPAELIGPLGILWDTINYISDSNEIEKTNPFKLHDMLVTIKQNTNEPLKPDNYLRYNVIFDPITGRIKYQELEHFTPSGNDIDLPIIETPVW